MQDRKNKVYNVFLTGFDLRNPDFLMSKWFKCKKCTYSRILRKCPVYYIVSEVIYAKRKDSVDITSS